MADDRTTLDFNFISLVLSVTGRVRPDDLQSVPSTQRTSLLHAFADAYAASQPLHFEGDTLVAGSGAPRPTPTAMPQSTSLTETVTAPVSPAIPEVLPETAYTSATAAVPAALAGFAPAAVAPAYPASPPRSPGTPPSAGAAPLPAADGAFFGMPEADFKSGPVTLDLADGALAGGPTNVAALAAAHDEPGLPKAAWWFWLLPVLLTWMGGLIAYFVVRPTNEKQARSMLITGFALTAACVLMGAAGFIGIRMLAGQ